MNPEEILGMASDLFRRGVPQSVIDGRFLYEVWDRSWIGWIHHVRSEYFGSILPPATAHGGRIESIWATLEPGKTDRLGAEIKEKCGKTGLSSHDVTNHVLLGHPIQLPPIVLVHAPKGISEWPAEPVVKPRIALLLPPPSGPM